MDFNADGRMDLLYFFLFAEHYETVIADPGWDPMYDLDEDGVMSLGDFFQFADWFPSPAQTYEPGVCGADVPPADIGG